MHLLINLLKESSLPGTCVNSRSPARSTPRRWREDALRGCDVLIHAVPVQSSREALSAIKHLVPREAPVVAVSKGIELGSRKLMCDVIPGGAGKRGG